MDTFTVLFFLLLLGGFCALWKSYFFPSGSLHSHRRDATIACLVMAACAAGIALALSRWSAADVRGDPAELAFYVTASLLSVVAAQLLFPFLGISLRDDGVERRNLGALFAVCGLTIGVSCCIAGSNVGNGPGEEAVLFCAMLSTGTLLALWLLLAKIGDLAETITVERDAGAGLRAGAFFAGCGAILGAAVAGDWISLVATLRDFVRWSWPVGALTVLLVVFERRLKRRPLRERMGPARSGVLSLIVTIAAAAYAVWVARQ